MVLVFLVQKYPPTRFLVHMLFDRLGFFFFFIFLRFASGFELPFL